MSWLPPKPPALVFAQRVVIVVALGTGLATIGSYIQSTQTVGLRFGWFGYAPLNSAAVLERGGLTAGEMLWIWLGLILAWMGTSVVLLHQRPSQESRPHGGYTDSSTGSTQNVSAPEYGPPGRGRS